MLTILPQCYTSIARLHKSNSSTRNGKNLWEALDLMVDTAVSKEKPAKAADELLKNDLDKFMKNLPIGRINCPLNWWQNKKLKFPVLTLLA